MLSMKECNVKIIMRNLMIARSFIWSVNWRKTLHSRKEGWVNTLDCSGSVSQSFCHLLSNKMKLQPLCRVWVRFISLYQVVFFCICIWVCYDEMLFFSLFSWFWCHFYRYFFLLSFYANLNCALMICSFAVCYFFGKQ